VPYAAPEEFEPTAAFLKEAEPFFRSLKIPFRDITPEVTAQRRAAPGRYVLSGDHHPNEAGANLIADVSWRFLLREALVPRPQLP
jgi:hypothetical protein